MEPPGSITQDPEIPSSSSVPRAPSAAAKLPGSNSAPKLAANKPKDAPTASKPSPMLPLIRKSTGGMNFTHEEIKLMNDSYDIMEEADASKGIEAWAKFATTVGNDHLK